MMKEKQKTNWVLTIILILGTVTVFFPLYMACLLYTSIICFIIAHWIRIRRQLLLASGNIMRLISLSACISLNYWTLFL